MDFYEVLDSGLTWAFQLQLWLDLMNHDNASLILLDINEVRIFRQIQILMGVNSHQKLATEELNNVNFILNRFFRRF